MVSLKGLKADRLAVLLALHGDAVFCRIVVHVTVCWSSHTPNQAQKVRLAIPCNQGMHHTVYSVACRSCMQLPQALCSAVKQSL